MFGLFLIIVILSIISFIVGMVKPNILKMGSRKKVFQITAAVGVVSFILMVVSTPPSEEAIALKKEKEEAKIAKKEAKIAEKEAREQAMVEAEEKKEAHEQALVKAKESWPEFNKTMNEHYKDAGVIAIRANEDMKVFDAVVPDEYKLSNENEKQYYVDKVGPLIESDITQHFNGEFISLYFIYEDGTAFADPKFTGGWKIKK